MSSENYVRIIMAENLRFPEEGSSAQGKPGAKARRRRERSRDKQDVYGIVQYTGW